MPECVYSRAIVSYYPRKFKLNSQECGSWRFYWMYIDQIFHTLHFKKVGPFCPGKFLFLHKRSNSGTVCVLYFAPIDCLNGTRWWYSSNFKMNPWLYFNYFLLFKGPGRKADHWTPSTAEVKLSGGLPPLHQSAFMAWCSVKAQGKLYLSPLPYLKIIPKTLPEI
jgi:hypothetical protein